jgi:hypothetical protein
MQLPGEWLRRYSLPSEQFKLLEENRRRQIGSS